MSRPCTNAKRAHAPKGSPDAASFPKGGTLKVDRNSGREHLHRGSYEEQTQLNRSKNPTVIKYQ